MSQQSITATTITGETPVFDNRSGYFVLTTDSETGDPTATATAGDISGNIIVFGDGNQDHVVVGSATATATASGTDATATATANIGNITGNTITFGNGNGNFVQVSSTVTVSATATATDSATAVYNLTFGGSITGNTIKFGGGNNNFVEVGGGTETTSQTVSAPGYGFASSETSNDSNSIEGNTITFGDGSGNHVSLGVITEITNITLNGTLSSFTDTFQEGDISGNKITFGNGKGDYLSEGSFDLFTGNTITFGNGNNDSVTAGQSSGNTIILGNGNGDTVTLVTNLDTTYFPAGGDTIFTGTGANDQINVGFHNNPDIFGFALGTNGTHFTTVTGALVNDTVVVNGGQLGGTPSSASGPTTATTLASYIQSLGTLTPGDTYVGYNNTTANETFIVTDTASGHTGAIELMGVAFQHSTLAGHTLTLA